MGHKIKVEKKKNFMSLTDNHGLSDFQKNVITLQDVTKSYSLEQMEHTFYHELVHFILNAMNEHELNTNEKFVDLFGGLLHQALNTYNDGS